MDNIGYVAMGHAALLERAFDVTANNIANANTDGFRATRNSFEELVANIETEDGPEQLTYSYDRSYVDQAYGAIVQTGSDLDVAIQGAGWFGYQTPEGVNGLGRDGRFTTTAEGFLRTTGGNTVLDAGGGPILIPDGSGKLSIARDGTIANEAGEVIGTIGVFEEPNIAAWLPAGKGMFVPPGGNATLMPALGAEVLQGHIEGSNVNAVTEMTRMIDQQRAYERSMTLSSSADELRKDTLSRLGRPA